MEYALRVSQAYDWKSYFDQVLILVLMEYALRVIMKIHTIIGTHRLNPCFNGICSARTNSYAEKIADLS